MKMDTRNIWYEAFWKAIYIKTKEKLKWTHVSVCPRKVEAREGWH